MKRSARSKLRRHAYVAGYDCAKKGANTINCHFKYFSTRELSQEWERGKADEEREKQKRDQSCP